MLLRTQRHGGSAAYWLVELMASAVSSSVGVLDTSSMSRGVSSSEEFIIADGVGVVAELDWPGKFANFLFDGVYSHARSLAWHLAHLGKSPLHFVLWAWHCWQARDRGTSDIVAPC